MGRTAERAIQEIHSIKADMGQGMMRFANMPARKRRRVLCHLRLLLSDPRSEYAAERGACHAGRYAARRKRIMLRVSLSGSQLGILRQGVLTLA